MDDIKKDPIKKGIPLNRNNPRMIEQINLNTFLFINGSLRLICMPLLIIL